MKQRLAWNHGKPYRPSYRPVSVLCDTLLAMGTPPFHAKRSFKGGEMKQRWKGDDMKQRLAWNHGKPYRPSYRPVSVLCDTLLAMGTPRFTPNALSKEVRWNSVGREMRWNSVWREIMVSRTGHLTDQSVFCVTRCSPWERPRFMPNDVSSHVFSFVFLFRLETLRCILYRIFRFPPLNLHKLTGKVRREGQCRVRTIPPKLRKSNHGYVNVDFHFEECFAAIWLPVCSQQRPLQEKKPSGINAVAERAIKKLLTLKIIDTLPHPKTQTKNLLINLRSDYDKVLTVEV